MSVSPRILQELPGLRVSCTRPYGSIPTRTAPGSMPPLRHPLLPARAALAGNASEQSCVSCQARQPPPARETSRSVPSRNSPAWRETASATVPGRRAHHPVGPVAHQVFQRRPAGFCQPTPGGPSRGWLAHPSPGVFLWGGCNFRDFWYSMVCGAWAVCAACAVRPTAVRDTIEAAPVAVEPPRTGMALFLRTV